ncbi:hypothetical protein BaRGS_00000269 [Batillaria attramentaria]|uniref:Uncharacterized protein n=1 Tax=Batillaria attramentaria TaxID=370345 RepID=A0ABD0M9Z5_9CAEN
MLEVGSANTDPRKNEGGPRETRDTIAVLTVGHPARLSGPRKEKLPQECRKVNGAASDQSVVYLLNPGVQRLTNTSRDVSISELWRWDPRLYRADIPVATLTDRRELSQ